MITFYDWFILIGVPLFALLSIYTLIALAIELLKLINSALKLLNKPIPQNIPDNNDQQYCYGYKYYSYKYFWHIIKFPCLWFRDYIIKRLPTKCKQNHNLGHYL